MCIDLMYDFLEAGPLQAILDVRHEEPREGRSLKRVGGRKKCVLCEWYRYYRCYMHVHAHK